MDKHNKNSVIVAETKKDTCFVPLRRKRNRVAVLVHSMLPNGYTASDRARLKEFEKRIMEK